MTVDYLRSQRNSPSSLQMQAFLMHGSKTLPRAKPRIIIVKTLTFKRRAQIALTGLLPADFKNVTSSMDKLKRYPLYELIGKDVHKIQDRDAYIVYASKFGIVFVLEDVSVEIQDIFPLGRLSQIANKRDAQPFI